MSGGGGSHLAAALEKFRSQAARNLKVQEDGRQEREDKLRKRAAQDAAKKPAKARAAGAKAKSSAASASAVSDAPSVSGAAGGRDWKGLTPPHLMDPLAFRQKTVIEFLRRMERPLTAAEILQGTQRDLNAEADLREALAQHVRVEVLEDGRYRYQAAIQVKDKAALLDYVRRVTGERPVAVGEITDAYGGAAQDIEALKREGHVMALHSYELQDDVLYGVDPRLAAMPRIEGELRKVWEEHCGELPDNDDDLADELRRIKVEPAPRKAPRKRSAGEKKKKARKPSRIRNVTNVHMMHLFEGEAPTQID